MLYWWSKFVLLGPLLRLFCRPTIEGLEHIPARGGAILASNHLAVVDSFLLPLLVPRRGLGDPPSPRQAQRGGSPPAHRRLRA